MRDKLTRNEHSYFYRKCARFFGVFILAISISAVAVLPLLITREIVNKTLAEQENTSQVVSSSEITSIEEPINQ